MLVRGRRVPTRVIILIVIAGISLPIVGGLIAILGYYLWEYYHPR